LIDILQNTIKYLDRLNKFLDFVFEIQSVIGIIRSSCLMCHYNKWETRNVVFDHLICMQFKKNKRNMDLIGRTYDAMQSRDTKVVKKKKLTIK